jgi:hypothetical protein
MQDRKRSISVHSEVVRARAEEVFPLLCPVREYEWIEGWQGKLVYADSGLAELDCVFTAELFPEIGPETWTCSHYEPPRRIDYVRMSPHTVLRLELTLSPAGTGTRVEARIVATAVDETGDDRLAGFDTGLCQRHFGPCLRMLDHFLVTGAKLPQAEALAAADLDGSGHAAP